MDDHPRTGIPPGYVTKPTRSTQPCIPLGSLNRVLALTGWGKGGHVTSAGWQVTLCDPIWQTAIRFPYLTLPDVGLYDCLVVATCDLIAAANFTPPDTTQLDGRLASRLAAV